MAEPVKPRKSIYAFYEESEPAPVDVQRAAKKGYMDYTGRKDANIYDDYQDIEEDWYDAGGAVPGNPYSKKMDDLTFVRDSIYNAKIDELPGLFEADIKRLQENDALSEFDIVPVELSGSVKNDNLIRETGAKIQPDDKVVIMGHSSANRIGGTQKEIWKDAIGDKGDECILGMCGGEKYGQKWANTLERPVTAQNNSRYWSGTNPAGTDLNSIMFYDYDDKSAKTDSTYMPAIKAKPPMSGRAATP